MKIKKGWKITWIALGSLLGLVVVVLAVALWLVFTPSKLTKIVNSLADNYITCEAKFGNVDLTFLSTFPDAGLKIEDVVIVNSMEGSANDTLAKIGSLTVGIDVMAFLKDNKVIVHQVKLDDARANLYRNGRGESNFDIFPPSEKEDTTSTAFPELIDLKKIKVNNLSAQFVDEQGGMWTIAEQFDLSLKGGMKGKDIDGDLYVWGGKLDVTMLNSGMTVSVDGLEVDIDGKLNDENIDADMRVNANKLFYQEDDSTGNAAMKTTLDNVDLRFDGKGTMDEIAADLKMKVEKGQLEMGKTEMVNETLRASKKDLLKVELPHLTVKLNKKEIWIDNSQVSIDDYVLNLGGQIFLANDHSPLRMDVNVNTEDSWQVKTLLAIVPEQYTGFLKGMDVDGKLDFDITAAGALTDSTMPGVGGTIWMEKGRFYAPKMLPYKLDKMEGKMVVDVYPDKSKESWVKIEKLKAHTRGTNVSIEGRVDDLMGDMRVDARVKGTLPLEDVKPMIPKGMNLVAQGNAEMDLKTNFKMSQLQKRAFEKVNAMGSLKLREVDVTYDNMHLTAPKMAISLQMPVPEKGRLGHARIVSDKINLNRGKNLKAEMESADIDLKVNNMMKEQLAATFNIELGALEAEKDSMNASLGGLKLAGSVRLDSTQRNLIKQYNPQFNATTHNVLLYMPKMPEAVRLAELDLAYSPTLCNIKTAKARIGHSDIELYGTVSNLEDWLDNKAMLKGDLNLTSEYADVDQLMNMISGIGSNADSLKSMRKEDAVPEEANPFIVPRNVNVTLNTHIKRSIAFGNDLHDVAGALTVNDGRVVLDQMGFVCKAARMQLTALYRSPRPGNLFAAIDFHLLDIQIDELLNMIPAVDTLVPMLSAFDGKANFHLAGESYLDAFYRPKMSSLKGAAAISGQDLVVMDNSDLSTIAKLMRFKSWRDKDNKIKIDSLSVEMTCMDVGHGTEIEVLPFLLSMGSYQICISGVQQFNKDCVYHLELLKNPLLAKVGVDVKGSITKPKISLGKVIYADLFRPKRHGVAEKKALEIKNKVRQALEANVR